MPARTDDIAEKVFDLLFDETTKGLNMIWDAGSKVAPATVLGIAGAVDELIKRFQSSKDFQKMLEKTGPISTLEMTEINKKLKESACSVSIADSEAKEYEELLQEQGVLYSKVDKQDDNCKVFIFLGRDQQKVENVTAIMKSRRGEISELRPDLYFNSLSPSKVHAVEGLSAVEMELFRHYARGKGLLYTSVSQKDGYMVVCDVKDKQKADKALLNVGWALTGARGERVRQQLEYRLHGRTSIQIAAEEAERELYIVSGKNPQNYVCISSEDLQIYKNNKQVTTISRSAPDFYAQCMTYSEGLKDPVVLEAVEFEQLQNTGYLENVHSINMFPEVFDELIEQESLNRMMNLVATKYSLDNEGNASWGIEDPSIGYSEFSGMEYISDQDEREARELEFEHYKDAAFYSRKHHKDYSVDMEEKSVDFLIAKAEEKRKVKYGLDDNKKRTSERTFGKGKTESQEERY